MYVLGQKGLCFVSQTHPVVPSLIWSLCSSDRRFAVRFLQISRHREHPCVKLTVTSVFTARDLHPIDYAHAGRTKTGRKNSHPSNIATLFICHRHTTCNDLLNITRWNIISFD